MIPISKNTNANAQSHTPNRSFTLDGAWVQHHADRLANRRRRQVVPELRLHHARVSVGGNDLAPHDTIARFRASRSLLLRRCLVHVRYSLADVKRSLVPRIDAFNLQPRLLDVLVFQVALVSNVDGLAVESSIFAAHDGAVQKIEERG